MPNTVKNFFIGLLLCFILTFACLIGACNQFSQGGAALAEIAVYDGADRAQRLIAGAKQEGGLTLYTSVNKLQPGSPVIDAFERKYGLKVTVWRAAANKVLQRVLTEAKAGRFDFDVINAGALELEALHRENLLQKVKSPQFPALLAGAVPSHHEWAGIYLLAYVQAYNTALVQKKDLPKSYQDLLHPKWKGRLGIEAKDYDWFYSIVKYMGEEKGVAFFKTLAAQNGLSVRNGHTLLANLVAAGEVPLALTVYHYTPEQLKQKGAPIDWFAIRPVIAGVNAMGVSRKAAHPHAALLFYDYMIGEDAQRLLVAMNYAPVNTNVASPWRDLPIEMIDPAVSLDESEKWIKLYEHIILQQEAKKP